MKTEEKNWPNALETHVCSSLLTLDKPYLAYKGGGITIECDLQQIKYV